MTDFVRQALTAETVQAIRAFDQTTGTTYKQYMNIPTTSRYFKTPQLLAILQVVLGERILTYFLKEDSERTFYVAGNVIDDHMRINQLRGKDLQVNLVVNIILQIVRAQNLPKANRFGYGENMVRTCKFDPQFKHALKVAMFDCKAIDLPWLVIAHHFPDSLDPGIWMEDIQ